MIFARTKADAGNYKALATKILEDEMKLTVNKEKTHLTELENGVKFLGVVIWKRWITIQETRLKRFKDKIRGITKRNKGKPLAYVIKEITPVLRGWVNYYRVADIKMLMIELMKWIRRRLRMIKMKQWKTYKAMHKAIRRNGIKADMNLKMDVTRWKNSKVHIIHMLMPNSYFEDLGLYNLTKVKVGLLSHIAMGTA